MKHLPNGAAIAAVRAIAGPAGAANSTGTQIAAVFSTSDTTSAAPPKHRHARTRHCATHRSTALHHLRHGQLATTWPIS